MSDFPSAADYSHSIISIFTEDCIGLELLTAGSGFSTAAWPSANAAILIPFTVAIPTIITQIFWLVGTSGTDNIDVGIYDSQGNKIISTGSTALSGTSANQIVDITDTTLQKGLYYIAVVMNGTTNTLSAMTPVAGLCRTMGIYSVATSFPLPSTITFAGTTLAYIPRVHLTLRTVV